jgi:hypothetical protein
MGVGARARYGNVQTPSHYFPDKRQTHNKSAERIKCTIIIFSVHFVRNDDETPRSRLGANVLLQAATSTTSTTERETAERMRGISVSNDS